MLKNRLTRLFLRTVSVANRRLGILKYSNNVQNQIFPDTVPLRNRKAKSSNPLVQHYVDEVFVRVQGGKGGDGCINFLQDWCNERGGPDGGDGGNGGHVLFVTSSLVTGLNHFKKSLMAKSGNSGSVKAKTGKNAEHTVVHVPIGTTVKNEKGQILADMNREGMIFVAARGGSGGKGNQFFKNSTEQAPKVAEYGADGEIKSYCLEIKSMAHVGLLGFPNAGKSTLLRAITRARPKVEPYPFTTLNPHIGMVLFDDYEQIAVADLPGLIPDSHKNKGLGIEFLKHVERCCCLMYVLDASTQDPWNQFNILQYELSQFEPTLLQRPMIIVANKIDLPEAQANLPLIIKYLNHDVISLSAKTGVNLTLLLKNIRKVYDENKHFRISR